MCYVCFITFTESWLPNVTCPTTKAVHTGYVMQVSYLRISDGLQQAWELTYHYHVFRDLHHKLSRYLPASSFDADSQFPSMVSTFLTGFSDKVKFERLNQLDRWMVKVRARIPFPVCRVCIAFCMKKMYFAVICSSVSFELC